MSKAENGKGSPAAGIFREGSIAESLYEQGMLKGSRKAILGLLMSKFKNVPDNIITEVQATTDFRRFEKWLVAILTAGSLADMPFKANR